MKEKNTNDLLKTLSKINKYEEYPEKCNDSFIDTSIAENLNRIIKEKNLVKSEVIRKSEIDEVYGYQIFSGKKNPTRDYIIALSIGMELSLEETQQLLKSCKYPFLYAKIKRDSIIIFGINKHLDVPSINELLYNQNEDTLNI